VYVRGGWEALPGGHAGEYREHCALHKGGEFSDFLKDRRTQDALVRNLEVLGVSIPFTVAQSDRTILAASLMGPFPLASRQTISSQRAALLAGASEIKVAIFVALAQGSRIALRRPRSS